MRKCLAVLLLALGIATTATSQDSVKPPSPEGFIEVSFPHPDGFHIYYAETTKHGLYVSGSVRSANVREETKMSLLYKVDGATPTPVTLEDGTVLRLAVGNEYERQILAGGLLVRGQGPNQEIRLGNHTPGPLYLVTGTIAKPVTDGEKPFLVRRLFPTPDGSTRNYFQCLAEKHVSTSVPTVYFLDGIDAVECKVEFVGSNVQTAWMQSTALIVVAEMEGGMGYLDQGKFKQIKNAPTVSKEWGYRGNYIYWTTVKSDSKYESFLYEFTGKGLKKCDPKWHPFLAWETGALASSRDSGKIDFRNLSGSTLKKISGLDRLKLSDQKPYPVAYSGGSFALVKVDTEPVSWFLVQPEKAVQVTLPVEIERKQIVSHMTLDNRLLLVFGFPNSSRDYQGGSLVGVSPDKLEVLCDWPVKGFVFDTLISPTTCSATEQGWYVVLKHSTEMTSTSSLYFRPARD